MSPVTVGAYAHAPAFPERSIRQPKASRLDPYLEYLEQRWLEGCQNATQLWRELQEKGFTLSRRQVMRWVQHRREEPAPTTPKMYRAVKPQVEAPEILSPVQFLGEPRQLVWLLLRRRDDLVAKDQAVLEYIVQDQHIREAYELAQRFRDLLHERNSEGLSAWLADCAASRLVDLRTFAASLRRDQGAVAAAIEKEWSTGQVEGQNTRVKLLKRQMYGRASFDLLRRRVLYQDSG